jgi:predicted ester cyclase
MADYSALADRFNEAFNRHDANALDELAHAEIVSVTPTGEVRGREAGRAYNQAWFDAFPDARIRTTKRIVSGNVVVEEGTFEGNNTGTFKTPMGDIPATGRHLKGNYCGVSEYEGDLVKSTRLYYDQVDVLTQLGLMPAPAAAS